MVDLVLERSGLEAARDDHLRRPGRREGLDDDLGRPAYVGGQVGDAQAALAAELLAVCLDDLGIDENETTVTVTAARMQADVNDYQAQEFPDLRRRHPDAARKGQHRLDQILGETTNPRPVPHRNLGRDLLQRWIGKAEDLADWH